MFRLILGDTVYNVLKNVVQIYLPAAATLYFALGSIWGWSNVENVIGTITAVTVFLGGLLGLSGYNYHKSSLPVRAVPDGVLNIVRQEDDTILYDFDANDSMTDLRKRDTVVFKINNEL